MAKQRLVDAEALKRSIIKQLVDSKKSKRHGVLEIVGECIDHAPTVEAKPVVHCKDCCCFCHMGSVEKYFCERFGGFVTAEDYCSRYTLENPNCGAQMDESIS